MLGHHQHASKTPFKWRFASGPMMAHLEWYLDPPTPHQLKKNFVKVGPPLTKFSGSAHDCDCFDSLDYGGSSELRGHSGYYDSLD